MQIRAQKVLDQSAFLLKNKKSIAKKKVIWYYYVEQLLHIFIIVEPWKINIFVEEKEKEEKANTIMKWGKTKDIKKEVKKEN